MEKSELRKRIEELRERSEQRNCVTNSLFLTPAEQYEINNLGAFYYGGNDYCERKVAFFLPDYIETDSFEFDDYLSAIKIQAFFGKPEHRDYMGAILGIGIKREWLGDIRVIDDVAYVFCMPSIKKTLCEELVKVGRISVKANSVKLKDVPAVENKTIEKVFTVKSTRIDAIVADMFSLSRNNAAKAIREGLVSYNYEICDKTDKMVNEGDVISLRGKGKGTVSQIGRKTKKDRIVIITQINK